jgi:hypothetical protein
MFQSSMLRSRSSIRVPYLAGVHWTFAFSCSNCWRTSLTAISQSSATRKTSEVSRRQHCGYSCTIVPASADQTARLEVVDGSDGLVDRDAGQPAVVQLEAPSLVQSMHCPSRSDARLRLPRGPGE